MKYVIIGGCIAACGAIEGIRSKDSAGQIIVIDGEKRGAYTRPLISYLLSDQDKLKDINYRPADFFDQHRVEIIPAMAVEINRPYQQVILDNGDTVEYNRLLLATGAIPVSLPIPGADENWVYNFYTLEDVWQINEQIQLAREAVVIGSGLIGMKAAEALHKRGLKVYVVEKEPYILPRQLNPAAAAFIHHHLAEQGINILTSEEVAAITKQHQVELKNGRVLSADLVVIGAGTRPRVELAVNSGLPVRQGIVTDSYLKTADERIYAAGDVAETLNTVSGQMEVMALLPHAHQEGYLAGCNMAGHERQNQGSIPMNSVKLLGWNICSAGYTEEENAEILSWQDNDRMLELNLRENCLIGYIAVNIPEVTGPLTNAIAQKIPAADNEWQNFMAAGPALTAIPSSYWQAIKKG